MATMMRSNDDDEDGGAAGVVPTPMLKPLFSSGPDCDSDDGDGDEEEEEDSPTTFADGFRDKVRALFERFDVDQDGHLNYPELRELQRATTNGEGNNGGGESNGTDDDGLSEEMYLMACRTLDCSPSQGLTLEALRFTYAAEASSGVENDNSVVVDRDYNAVFGAERRGGGGGGGSSCCCFQTNRAFRSRRR